MQIKFALFLGSDLYCCLCYESLIIITEYESMIRQKPQNIYFTFRHLTENRSRIFLSSLEIKQNNAF